MTRIVKMLHLGISIIIASVPAIGAETKYKNVSELLKRSTGAQRGLVQVVQFPVQKVTPGAKLIEENQYMTLRGAISRDGLGAFKTCLDYQAKEILEAQRILDNLPLSRELFAAKPLSEWAINFRIYDNSNSNLSAFDFEERLKSGLEQLKNQVRDQFLTAFEPETLSLGASPLAGLKINRSIEMGGIDGTCDFQIAVHAAQSEGAPTCEIIRAGTITRAVQNIDR